MVREPVWRRHQQHPHDRRRQHDSCEHAYHPSDALRPGRPALQHVQDVRGTSLAAWTFRRQLGACVSTPVPGRSFAERPPPEHRPAGAFPARSSAFLGSPNMGLPAVLAPRAREQCQVPRDGADRAPDAVALGHHPLRLADAQPVAVHKVVGQPAGPVAFPGRQRAVLLALWSRPRRRRLCHSRARCACFPR